MRGKRLDIRRGRFRARIIPAHAGQTSQFGNGAWVETDHPRACGANNCIRPAVERRAGSSPRMRGKRHRLRAEKHAGRIIPAHAGQTLRVDSIAGRQPDHPRACGANNATQIIARYANGSSPRMRGKHEQHRTRLPRRRIIPAHAGQTGSDGKRHPTRSDHPRACGANAGVLAVILGVHFESGSSPRMRGKLIPTVKQFAAHRIIPAHAGQTT